MGIQDKLNYIWQIVGLIVGGTFVIQVSPIKLNPWGWFLKRLGKEVNEELNQNITEVSKKVDELEAKVETIECEFDEDNAKQNRRRILRFADECRRSEKHSEEHFTEMIEGDVKAYKNYCKNHPEFENDKCVMSIEFIEDAYKYCMSNNAFLN